MLSWAEITYFFIVDTPRFLLAAEGVDEHKKFFGSVQSLKLGRDVLHKSISIEFAFETQLCRPKSERGSTSSGVVNSGHTFTLQETEAII